MIPLRDPLPNPTADLPGTGGVIKSSPQDFVVDEIPAYDPCGTGEHLFLHIEKTGLTTDEAALHIARALGISRSDIGTAGLKDKHAVTRQWISLPARQVDDVHRAETEWLRILDTGLHRNKLKTGHLRGNRFSIRLRSVQPDAIESARAKFDRFAAHGFANYYGEQRFGRDGETLELGFQLLRGEKQPRDLPHQRRRFLLRMALSAVQSALFNEVLARRIEQGTFTKALVGDVMQVVESGGPFLCEEPAVDQCRLDRGEIVPTGPLFGGTMRAAAGVVGKNEAAVLEESGLSLQMLSRFPKLTSGARRATSIRPADVSTIGEQDYLILQFTLPPGSYATAMLEQARNPS